MGNQLAGIAPSQIYPVEHYLIDHNELKFDVSLGSTRFFKVARAESQEGLVVVKVFAIHDVSLPLQPYKERITDIKEKLLSAVNCLPIRNIVVTEKSALLMREYVKSSLYDRISTRPFLTNIEKLWITFQVLCALHQSHKVGVCHGDIKLENITVTSWNWVLLVDFASFKPTFLPEDNPADFSYFFDTSRRRTCYIAPERFVTSTSDVGNNAGLALGEAVCNSAELKPAMDVFSAGCALIEFWNEGAPPFDLSQLLAYRSGEYDPSHHLEKIENPDLRALLANMIERDPTKRQTAELYLNQERSKLFPNFFYEFLLLYMQMFSASPILFTDEKVVRLKKDISSILKDTLDIAGSSDGKEDENDGKILIVSLVTSCVRGLHECTSKLQLLEILLELAKNVSDEIVLDRILPYMLYFVHDTNAMVKVSSIQVITKCLDLIKHVPKSNSNIFSDYVLPELSPLAVDVNTSVRAAYARNIGTLAQISMRYLKQTKSDTCAEPAPAGAATTGGDEDEENENDRAVRNYHMELQSLRDMIERTVSPLLVDNDIIVKQTLLLCGIDKLCHFFGKQKTNDLILTHMITFLNENNKELRGAFFDCIVGVASFIGSGCASVITPLLLQGLTDSSEFVVTKSIDAMSLLTEANIFYKNHLCELIKETSCFLVHPNLWIRMAVAGFISLASTKLSTVDVQCKIMPNIAMYMKHELIQIQRAELLLDSLCEPISRKIFDDVIAYRNINDVFHCLKERQKARTTAVTRSMMLNAAAEMHQSLISLFRRITAEGLTDGMEEYLLIMESHLKKIHRHKIGQELPEGRRPNGVIQISPNVMRHVCNLADNRMNDLHSRNTHRIAAVATTSSDWNILSSEALLHPTSSGRPLSRPTTPPNVDRGLMSERSFIEYRRSNCSKELNYLLSRQQDRYSQTMKSREWIEQATWKPQLPPPGWKLRGSLVAHLHEHKAPITKLAALNDSSLFASSSRDGYIRIWELQKMEGKNIANRSKQSYKMSNSSPIIGMAVCEQGQSIAAAAEDGSISVIRLEVSSSRMSLVQVRQLDPESEIKALDLQYVDAGPQSLLVYSTLNGKICGWDLRSPEPAYTLTNSLRNGIATSLCVEPQNNWLTVGTSSGYVMAWDLRFQIPILEFIHPSGLRIRKIVKHPTNPSAVITSVQGSNEVSIWDLESSNRRMVLWSSRNPPFVNPEAKGGVYALQTGCIDRSPYVITGGTDQRIRLWDISEDDSSASESYLVAQGANDILYGGGTMEFYSCIQEGVKVIYTRERPTLTKLEKKNEDNRPKAGPDPPAPGHYDAITDLCLCKASQCFLLSSCRSGIIKVWK